MTETSKQGQKNRLATSNSPYLLLHATNPVDWYPWGEEAFERARREDRPIFLSIGYTACHWCHVMERESFANPRVADVLNEAFVNVKVDREERPDVDAFYMAATQMIAGHGGWPNSVFLTPRLEPFFAGTYFPPEDRQGHPGLITVARALARAWQERRKEVEAQAAEVMAALREHFSIPQGNAEPPEVASFTSELIRELEQSFDKRFGGFGGAPKFPNAPLLVFLEEVGRQGNPRALAMLDLTLREMARGGIFDQVGGGFHRYATDATWTVPHFEKMLDDNAQLLEIYARAARRTGDPEFRRAARNTAEFLLKEMRGPEGAFFSSIDADSEGQEGAFYVWEVSELVETLGEEDFVFLEPIFGWDEEPNFEKRAWVLRWARPLWVLARERRSSPESLLSEVERLLEKLRERRKSRPYPQVDDKLLLDRNGMAVAALAVAAERLERPDWREAAEKAARFLLQAFWDPDAGWLRVWRNGQRAVPALLSDVANLARGLLVLARTTGERFWLLQAEEVARWMDQRFRNEDGAYLPSSPPPDLLLSVPDLYDGPAPSGVAVALEVLFALAAETGAAVWEERAEQLLRRAAFLFRQRPQATASLLRAAVLGKQMLDTFNRRGVALRSGKNNQKDFFEEPQVPIRLELGEPAWTSEGELVLRGAVVLPAGWKLEAFPSGERVLLASPEEKGLKLREVSSESEQLGFLLQVSRELSRKIEHIELRMRPCGEGRCLPDQRLLVSLKGLISS